MRRSPDGRRHTDWSPVNYLPESLADLDGPGPRDLGHARMTDARNGRPEPVPYRWRPGDAEREQEVQARLAASRAWLGGPA